MDTEIRKELEALADKFTGDANQNLAVAAELPKFDSFNYDRANRTGKAYALQYAATRVRALLAQHSEPTSGIVCGMHGDSCPDA